MKKILLFILLISCLAANAQIVNDSIRYNIYVNNLGYNAVSHWQEPQVAIWGHFSDLLSIPTTVAGYGITDAVKTGSTYFNPTWITSLAYSKLTGAPVLATVAISGAYSDLTGKPSLSTVAITGSYSDLIGKPTIYTFTGNTSQYTDGTGAYKTFPTTVSSFTNDAGYISNSTSINQISKTANYTIISTDFATNKQPVLYDLVDATSGSNTQTLPSATAFSGYKIYITKTDATTNSVTISGLSVDNIIDIKGSVKELIAVNGAWVNN